ncbi:AF4/FMR2 family member 1-like isoform X2 [Syngnathoides biaculeatus]|uniref:AF4/FMR2 family member 1-like isoform X2 n=1 Tax=Syngnathoides biaculeatus TaxID=300417 RepID=UPI002ADD6DCF|nr:AF4/FMR2 family member 1-like isoform X2 [Syngnathoides biaculeatus]
MASQPSAYDEERNRLRLQAWEQRNQETSQPKEICSGNVPLFGQPYKTSKGDELSNRIQRMLGSYEDVNNPTEPSAVPADFTQSDRGQPNSDRPGKPLVQDLAHRVSCQNLPSNSYPFQTMREIPPCSPNSHGRSLSIQKASLAHQKKVETLSDLREDASSSQERSAQCPDVKQIPVLHSSEPKGAKDSSDSHQETLEPASSATMVDISVFNLRQSPVDASLHQGGKSSNSLLSQNFPPLSSSKPPSVVTMQKPTAYVRPMDGQDQMLNGSPELKPSPEPRIPLQEIHKAHDAKAKMIPQYLEMNSNEAVCVEDILKEMTHSWPPLLSAIHIPYSDSSPTKEAEQVPSCPGGQKTHDHFPGGPRHIDLRSPKLLSHKEAHSSGLESASSSDSDSSSRSESDSESIADEPCGLIASNKIELDAAAACGNWQLGNWIRSSQQNSSNESQSGSNVVCENRTRNPLNSSEHLTEEATQQSRNPAGVQPCGKSSHESGSSEKTGARKLPKGYLKCEDTLEGKAPPFSDRPKVKMKTERLNNVSSDSKKKRTFKMAEAEKTEPRLEVVQGDTGCPTCPHHCSCHTYSHTPMLKITSCKANVEIVQQGKAIPKIESAPTQQFCKKLEHVPKSSQDIRSRPAGCLRVKIDLGLLSRVPQGTPGKAGTRKHPKASKKTLPQTADMDDKTLPRKKQKLEKKMTSTNKDSSAKMERCATQPNEEQHKMGKKKQVHLPKPQKDSGEDQKGLKGSRVEPHKDTPKRKRSSNNKSSHARHMRLDKKQSSSSRHPKEGVTSRPLLRLEDRQFPVKHYIKEAKRLKHKADAESDKRSKAFNYLDAAMFFVESGIAMESDPQISMSSYTMFAETVELLKFVLKLKNSADMTAPPSDKDFVALCLKCQSLLQMAMFRHKHKTAVKYSKTLTDHFNNPAREAPVCATKGPSTPSPMTGIPSPARGGGHTVAVPFAVEQVTLSYVNITTLFLSAHELWEQADQMAGKGSGLVAELDAALGPLSLTSSVRSMVRYTQQGVAWLRLDSSKAQKSVC